MTDGPSPSIQAGELHEISDAEACALVDRCLGEPSTWPAGLIPWRLGRESQADWKAEVGHWLRTAERHGFREKLVTRAKSRAHRVHKQLAGQRHANEKAHLDLAAELAPAMAVHYFVGTGWGFHAWEPESTLRDVDVELIAPNRERAVLQVKAPDEPDRHDDARVLTAIEKARTQLEGARQPSMIVISPQRNFPAAADPGFVESHLFGRTHVIRGSVFLSRNELGCVFGPDWRHIGAVVLLDHVRGATRSQYTCTVFVNPAADPSVRCDPAWYPRARVYWADGDTLTWQSGPPNGPVYSRVKIVMPFW